MIFPVAVTKRHGHQYRCAVHNFCPLLHTDSNYTSAPSNQPSNRSQPCPCMPPPSSSLLSTGLSVLLTASTCSPLHHHHQNCIIKTADIETGASPTRKKYQPHNWEHFFNFDALAKKNKTAFVVLTIHRFCRRCIYAKYERLQISTPGSSLNDLKLVTLSLSRLHMLLPPDAFES